MDTMMEEELKQEPPKYASISQVKGALEELAKRHDMASDQQKKTRRLMRDKFANRLYRMIKDPQERLYLLDKFLPNNERDKEERMNEERKNEEPES